MATSSTRRPILSALVAVVTVATFACGGAPEEAPSRKSEAAARACVPNQTVVCVCGLDTGHQRCTEDAKLTTCECNDDANGGQAPAAEPNAPAATPAKGACGNHLVDPGEACDDGNTTSGDGCSAACQPDGPPSMGKACPGQPVALWKGSSVLLAGVTAGSGNDMELSCWPSKGPDRVYQVRPNQDGFLTIDATFGADFNAVVELREGSCAASTAGLFCKDTLSRPFKNVVPVSMSKTYFLVIDGDAADAAGAYSIRLVLE